MPLSVATRYGLRRGGVGAPLAGGQVAGKRQLLSHVQASVPSFANVVLLLHCDGTNGGTTFTDSSNSAHTVTASGNANTTTAVVKYGTAAAGMDGTGDLLSMTSGSEMDFGTGDFTVELWVQWQSVGSTLFVGDLTSAGSGKWGFIYNNSDNKLKFIGTAGVVVVAMSNTWTPSANVWYHLAVSRSGTSVRFFVDGVQQGTTQTDSTSWTTASTTTRVGSTSDSALQMNGFFDDIRVVKGEAVYTANFTPPTAALPNS